MDVLHELSLLMVQARSYEEAGDHQRVHPDDLLSERIAAVRSVMIRDRIAAASVIVPAIPHTRTGRREWQSVTLHGRRVSLPAVVVQLARVLEANNERPILGRDLSLRLDGTPRKETVTDRVVALRAALFHANCGLSVHTSREGYFLIAEPITLAQRLEAAG